MLIRPSRENLAQPVADIGTSHLAVFVARLKARATSIIFLYSLLQGVLVASIVAGILAVGHS